MAISVSTPTLFTSTTLASASMNRMSGGWMAYGSDATTVSGISTSFVNCVSFSMTNNPGKLAFVSAVVDITSTVADNLAHVVFYEGATGIVGARGFLHVTGGPGRITVPLAATFTPTAGTQSYTIQAQLESGSGTLSYVGSSLTILDVGK